MIKLKSIFILLISFLPVMGLTGCKEPTRKNKNLVPTVDFIQNWYCGKWTVEEWDYLITELKEKGYESIVLQSTCELKDGIIVDTSYLSDVNSAKDTLGRLLYSAKNNDFGVYLGLISDESWWNTDNYNDDKMDMWADEQIKVADILYDMFYIDYKETIKGYYLSFELYSNTKGFELQWAKMVSKLIDGLNDIDATIPLVFSPFNSSNYLFTKRINYRTWSNFFKNTNFREIDLCVPQDGYGRYGNRLKKSEYSKVYDFLDSIYSAIEDHSKCQFGVNIEYFTNTSKVYATEERIAKQTELANQLANVIFSFSYSHYYYNKAK